MTPRSPRFARLLLELTLPPEEREFVVGDLEEIFAARVASGVSARAARREYWRAAFTTVVSLRRPGTRVAASGATGSNRAIGRARLLPVFRDAWRSVTLQLGPTGLVVATLAIGISVSTVMFAVANWLILRPIPGVQTPDRLVTVWASLPEGGLRPISESDRDHLERQSTSFERLAGHWTMPVHVVAPVSREPIRLQAQIVSAHYFDVLGPRVVALGRGFSEVVPGEPGQSPVAVISDRLWRRQFAGDTSAIGQAFLLNRQSVTLIGVATRGFHGIQRTDNADVWVPVTAHRIGLPVDSRDLLSDRRAALYYSLIGRLRPDASPATAETELSHFLGTLTAANPGDRWLPQLRFVADPAYSASPLPTVRARVTESVTILFSAAVLLLVLTSVNAGGLMLVRALSRQRDIAVRLALGATRGTIIAQCVIESLLLSLAGAATAMLVARLALSLLAGAVIYPDLPPLGTIGIDGWTFAFALGVATFAAAGAAVAPVLVVMRGEVSAADLSLKATHGRRHRFARQTLAAAQAALSLILLLGALLLLRSLIELRRIDPGFDVRPLVVFSVDPGLQGYDTAARGRFYRDLLSRVRDMPVLESASIASWRPFFFALSLPVVRPADRPNTEGIRAEANGIGTHYFRTLGIRVVDGHEFVDADLAAEGDGRVIVNESLARRLFGTPLAAGRHVLIEGRKNPSEVAGVVADVRSRTLREPPPLQMYWPFGRSLPPGSANVLVRTRAAPSEMVLHLRSAVHAVDPTMPIVETLGVSEAIDQHLAEPVLLGRLSGIFAILGALLCGLGIYGLLGRLVVERRPEFAIRLALGATPRNVLRIVISDSVRLAVVGVVIGMVGAYWLVPLIRSRLFGVSPLDGFSFAAAGAGIVALAVVAAVIPARRAARVDPILALKN